MAHFFKIKNHVEHKIALHFFLVPGSIPIGYLVLFFMTNLHVFQDSSTTPATTNNI